MQKVSTQIETQFREQSIAAWESEEFKAGLFTFQGYMRLSIWPLEETSSPVSWEALQKVKSDCGFGNFEAIEIYPRDGQVVNTANARHLYLVAEALPFAMKVILPPLSPDNTETING